MKYTRRKFLSNCVPFDIVQHQRDISWNEILHIHDLWIARYTRCYATRLIFLTFALRSSESCFPWNEVLRTCFRTLTLFETFSLCVIFHCFWESFIRKIESIDWQNVGESLTWPGLTFRLWMNKESAALSHIHGKHGTLRFVKSTLPWLIRFNAISLGGFFLYRRAIYTLRAESPLSLR